MGHIANIDNNEDYDTGADGTEWYEKYHDRTTVKTSGFDREDVFLPSSCRNTALAAVAD